MDIKQLTEQFKTFDELEIFVGSQYKQILNLSKKIKELEEKNKELQERVKENNNLSVLKPDTSNLSIPGEPLKLLNDSKTIAQVQIKMLKEEAFGRELTLEETKKLEIFNRILTEKEDKKEPIKANAKVLDDSQLINLITNVSTIK